MVAQMCFQNFGKELQPGDPRVGHQTQNLWNFWRPRLVAVSGWPCGSSETYFFQLFSRNVQKLRDTSQLKKNAMFESSSSDFMAHFNKPVCSFTNFFLMLFPSSVTSATISQMYNSPCGWLYKRGKWSKGLFDSAVFYLRTDCFWCGGFFSSQVDLITRAKWSQAKILAFVKTPFQNIAQADWQTMLIGLYWDLRSCSNWREEIYCWPTKPWAGPEHAKPKPTVFCYRQAQMLAVPPDHKSAPCIASDSGECWPLPHCGLQGADANPSWMEVMAL